MRFWNPTQTELIGAKEGKGDGRQACRSKREGRASAEKATGWRQMWNSWFWN